MRIILLSILFFMSASLFAQDSIRFRLTFAGQELEAEKSYFSSRINDSIRFEDLRFYITDLKLSKEGKAVNAPEKRHHLIDLAEAETQSIALEESSDISFDKLEFTLGVDSLTNVTGAHGGDLDPTQGMYWTWQSGYINFKLEGKTKTCPARNNLFQFHIGGYAHPFNSQQKIEMPLKGAKDIVIEVAIDKLLGQIDLAENYEVMSPNQKAMDLAVKLPAMFSITQ